MRFFVIRTSENGCSSRFNPKEKPCEEAFKSIFVNDYGKYGKEETEGWAVEINTLEELMSFYDKYGNLVITKPEFVNAIQLEIYDDYRE